MKKMAVVALFAIATGCVSELDTERDIVDKGTFGTTVITLMCKRIAYLEDLNDGDGVTDVSGEFYRAICREGFAPPDSGPGTIKALHAKRIELIAAIDTTFPPEFLGDLQGYLTSNEFLALYDTGETMKAVDALIEFLRFMADDQALPPALERLNHRLGYVPAPRTLGAVRAFVNYPNLHEFLLSVVDQITEGGQAKREFDSLVAAIAATMRNAKPADDVDAPDRTGRLAVDLLLGQRDELGTNQSIPMVLRDKRGLASVNSSSGLPVPFTDMDNDGLADADDIGRFTDASGEPIDAPAPFTLPLGDEGIPWLYRDVDGKALDGDGGTPVYNYVNLDQTVFAALVRDSAKLFDPQKGTALDLLRGASLLMGPREAVTKTYDNGETLDYRGYKVDEAPLLDIAFGFFKVLDDPNIYDVLALARKLFKDNEPVLARILEAVVTDTSRVGDLHPNAKLEAGSPLWDDMVPVLRQIINTPGLVRDLLRATEDTNVAELGLRLSDHMKYKDQFTFNPSDQSLVGSFSTEVNRSQADSGYNRSLMQRLLHVIADTNRAELCNKQDAVVSIFGLPIATYDRCDLLRIDNVAVFYMQSIAYAKDSGGNIIYDDGVPRPKARFPFTTSGLVGAAINSDLGDGILESESGIAGFTRYPTPEALNRTLFMLPQPDFLADTMGQARCRDGHVFTSDHAGTLPVWEKDGFYDQIRPIIQAFADHDAEQLFVDILSVLHSHWPSRSSVQHQQVEPSSPGYAWASNIASYEQIASDVLGRRSLMDAIVYGAPTLNATTANGKTFATIITNASRYILTPQAGLAKRNGDTTTTTADGRAVDTLSPWHIMADAWALKGTRMAVAENEAVAWHNGTRGLIDVLARGDAIPGTGWRFRNGAFRGIVIALIDFVDARLRAHDTAGDRSTWLSSELPDGMLSVFSSPVFAGAADFILSLQADPTARKEIEALITYLTNESNTDAFRTSLTSIADVLQLALDDRDIVPIAHVIGEALRPERGWLNTHLEWVKKARHADTNAAFTAILQNLFKESRPGHTGAGDLIDGISEVNRSMPYDHLSYSYSEDDYRSLFRNVAGFLDEEKRGLRKFISLIESRNK